jgi:hypothetical protein
MRHLDSFHAWLIVIAAALLGSGDTEARSMLRGGGRASFRLSLGKSLPAGEIVSAKIRIAPPSAAAQTFEPRTVDVKGHETFWVRNIAPGGEFVVEVEEAKVRLRYDRRQISLKGASLRCGSGPLHFPASVGLVMPLVLERQRGEGRVEVEVVRTDGKPVAAAFVRIFGESGDGRTEDPVTHLFTGPDGKGVASGLLPGGYRVRLAHPGRWSQPLSARLAEQDAVAAAKGGRAVRFEVQPAGEIQVTVDRGPYLPPEEAHVALRLRDEHGVWRSVENPEVTWTGEAFRVTALPPGRCQVRLLEPGCAISSRILEVRKDQSVSCRLAAGRALPAVEVV